MMKKLLFLSLFTAVSLQAVLVTLPEANVLTTRLRQAGFDDFIEKTDIVKFLAGQQEEAVVVRMSVELILCDYKEYMKKSVTPTVMRMSEQEIRTQLIQTILQDYPEAIKELKDYRFYFLD